MSRTCPNAALSSAMSAHVEVPCAGNLHMRFEDRERYICDNAVACSSFRQRLCECDKAEYGSLLAALLCVTTCVLSAGAETIDGTPDAYLEYIAATGEQYIDTRVMPSLGLKARIDMKWTDLTNHDWSFLDAKGSGDARFYMLHLYYYDNKPAICYGYGDFRRTSVSPSGVRHEMVSDFSDGNAIQIYHNGSPTIADDEQKSLAATVFDMPSHTLYLFACNDQGTPRWMAYGRLYGLKIFRKNGSDGFDLIRHYLPCLKNGRAALYEKVNGQICFSASGKDFYAGEELPRPAEMVEWVQSNNQVYQWLDTLVYGKSGLRSEVDFVHKDGSNVDRCVLGARGTETDSRFYLAYFYQNAFCYGHRKLYYPGGNNAVSAAATNGVRCVIKSELSAGCQSVTVNGTELHKEGVAHDDIYFATGNTLALFAMHNGTSSYTCYSSVRLFYAKIWDGDELLRDFAPCVDCNGKAGLYDSVTERMFYLGSNNNTFDPTNCVGAVTNWISASAGSVPDAKIEYIESNGIDDYFDLEVAAKDGVEMEAVMEWLTVPSDGAFVSARTDTPSTMRFFPYHYWSGYHRLGYAGDGVAYGSAATAGQKYKVVSRLDAGSQTAVISALVNGAWSNVGSTSRTTSGPVDTGLSLYLFARNYNNTADYPGHARVYKLKFREKQQDGSYKLTRDFVPCRKDGKAMLYDKVSGRFFRNKGRYLAIGGGYERPWFAGLHIIFR